MLFREGIEENLRFPILEVWRQIERTREYLRRPSEKLLSSIGTRDDYIDHLKSIIQRKCFSLAAHTADDDRAAVQALKSVDVITANLERIADFCENIIGQVAHLEHEAALRERNPDAFFDEVLAGVSRIEEAFFERDVQVALDICRCEENLDKLYARAFADVLEALRRGEGAQSHVTALFITHYFERMGDSLLNIGEAVISASLGERIKIEQFRALRESMGALDGEHSVTALSLEAVGETRSGCRIDRVSDASGDDERMVIFKEGRVRKLLEEKEGVDRWNTLVPGVAPRVYAFHEQEGHASILFEYLPGRTFEELLLQTLPGELAQALDGLMQTLSAVWEKTRTEEPASAGFVAQLSQRLGDIYAVHPEFRRTGGSIGPIQVPSFEDVVERASFLDAALPAPFSVLIHGDCNVDNVIWDPRGRRIRFIDLHRSGMMDYVQDVSVFLVSNHRLQVLETPVRQRIDEVIQRFYGFADGFASRSGDRTFRARLGLGLARSFATSTRFVLDEGFARSMLVRSRFLLEQLAATPPEALPDFEIPLEVLVD